MPSNVIATVRLNGFHRWPEAPDFVSHLRDRHRHLFTFKVKAEVAHDNRDIEFQMLQARIEAVLEQCYARGPLGFEFEAASCESLGRLLLDQMDEIFLAEVWEDDENGAEVTRG